MLPKTPKVRKTPEEGPSKATKSPEKRGQVLFEVSIRVLGVDLG